MKNREAQAGIAISILITAVGGKETMRRCLEALRPQSAELERRAEDSGETIKRRLRSAAQDIPHWSEYDYVLVNRDLGRSFARLRAILTAERLKRVQKPDIEKFVGGLLSDLRQLDR